MAKPAIDVALNNSSIDELLSPKPRTITMSEDHVALLSNSIDELLNPKTATPIEGRLQPLNSNSIGELLSPIPGVMEKSPAGNKVLNNSSIDELISPKTSNLTQSEVDLPPLTSFVFAHKVTKTPTYASPRYGYHTPFCRARSQCSCSSFYSRPLLHCASVLIYLHQF